MDRLLSLQELEQIPMELCPMMIFSDNERGLFSWAVKARTKGSYGHFMWLLEPGVLASQTLFFQLYPLHHYAGSEMKFVYNPLWTEAQRSKLTDLIWEDLEKPWNKRLYDIPGVIFRLFGLKWNLRGSNFCSERGLYLKAVDAEYDLKSPSPTDLNIWTKARQDRYKVYARYLPDCNI